MAASPRSCRYEEKEGNAEGRRGEGRKRRRRARGRGRSRK
jgi:hypothetical protein